MSPQFAEEIKGIISETENPEITVTLFGCCVDDKSSTLSGQSEIDLFFNWLADLELEIIKESESPRPTMQLGGYMYVFTSGVEGMHLFSYSPNKYIVYKGDWYSILNQSYPAWREFDTHWVRVVN
jgi:hypothetical protein